MNLAIFDFDGTISFKDSFRGFIIYYHGYLSFTLGSIILTPVYLLYWFRIISNNTMKEKVISYYFRGEVVMDFERKCLEYSTNEINKIIRSKAKDRIDWHQARGDKVIVVSASVKSWLKIWCEENKIELIATELDIKDGRLSGKLKGRNCYGVEKVNRIKKEIELEIFEEVYSYGDSKGDREILELATKGYFKPFRD